MKKVILILFLLLPLFSCNSKSYKDFESFSGLELIRNDFRRDDYKYADLYHFFDVRNKEEHQGLCPLGFNFISKDTILSNLKTNNATKKHYIILMGQNKDDSKPLEIKEFLIKEGYKNIYIYINGFEDYQAHDGKITENCDSDCGCE